MDLAPGFASSTLDAQAAFRAVLDALARPGTVHRIARLPGSPAPLSPAAAAIALTLFDLDTAVWLDPAADRPEVRAWLAFHAGCRLVAEPGEADFALLAEPGSVSYGAFATGTDLAPELAATLVLDLPALTGGPPVTLTGPGIETRAVLAPIGLPAALLTARGAVRFPRGFDCLLAAGDQVVGLPRTTRVEA